MTKLTIKLHSAGFYSNFNKVMNFLFIVDIVNDTTIVNKKERIDIFIDPKLFKVENITDGINLTNVLTNEIYNLVYPIEFNIDWINYGQCHEFPYGTNSENRWNNYFEDVVTFKINNGKQYTINGGVYTIPAGPGLHNIFNGSLFSAVWKEELNRVYTKYIKHRKINKIDIPEDYIAVQYRSFPTEQVNPKSWQYVFDIIDSDFKDENIYLLTDHLDTVAAFTSKGYKVFHQDATVSLGDINNPNDQPHHFINKNSGYELGLEVLTDAVMAANSKVFLHPISNIALAANYISKPNKTTIYYGAT